MSGICPTNVAFVDIAPILCAGVTVYKGLKATDTRPGDWVVVSGIGGLGHMAVQYAKAMGLNVVAVDISDAKLHLAKKLGASLAVNAREADPAAFVKKEVGGAQGVLVTAVSPKAFEQALGMVGRGGTVSLVGLPPGSFPLPIFDTVLNGITVRGSIVGTRLDLQEALDFAGAGKVKATIATEPLENINQIFARMHAGDIEGRIVIDFQKSGECHEYRSNSHRWPARTPMGAFKGELKGFAAPDLGAAAIRAAVERATIKPEEVDEVIMGCVLPAGQGQAPARQASLGAGLPLATGCTTINKMCGSGMKAAMLAHDLIAVRNERRHGRGRHGEHDQCAVSAPEGARRPAHGSRRGEGPHVPGRPGGRLRQGPPDGHFRRGLREPVPASRAKRRTRYAIDFPHPRAGGEQAAARSRARSCRWRSPGKGETSSSTDEQPLKANLEKIPTLKPAFRKDGTVTAANSSSISDGAAALVLMSRSKRRGAASRRSRAIAGHATHSQEPRVVHDRAGRRHPEALRQDRLDAKTT